MIGLAVAAIVLPIIAVALGDIAGDWLGERLFGKRS